MACKCDDPRVLDVRIGDTIIVSTDMVLKPEQREKLREIGGDLGTKLVALEAGLKVEGVIRAS